MIPVCKDAVQSFDERNYFQIFNLTLKISVPAAYVWLSIFYGFFHSYMNFWAELTYFGDRRFYDDWWNAGNLSEYWRKWNHPIHNFLIRHVYYPLRRRRFDKQACLLVTFLISALAHEYIVVGIFRVVNFIAFTIMIINVPIMIVQAKFKNVFNYQ
jgi:diacylglycerol O-acyltransferase-1